MSQSKNTTVKEPQNKDIPKQTSTAASQAKQEDIPLYEEIPPEVKANQHVLSDHFKMNYARSLANYLMSPIFKYYFRAKLVGFDEEDFPERSNPNRPLIFASNHSGMAFPWDAMVFSAALLKQNHFKMDKAVRPLVSPMLSKIKLMNPFLITNFWRKAGAIDATSLNFETLMHYPESNILIYPEGIDGIGKGFDKKYQLQRLSTSSLRMSIKYKVDVIPFATVNGEYINPFSYSVGWINDILRQFSVPFLPVGPLTLLILLQPWMFYFALPAKLTYVRGRRIKPYEMIDKPVEEITQEDLYELRDLIHEQMQIGLEEAVERYGQKPYDLQDMFITFLRNASKILYFVPIAWPFLFTEHERRYRKMQQYMQYMQHKQQNKGIPQSAEGEEEFELPRTEEQDLWSMVKTAANTVAENPEVLLMYVPIGGLIPLFTEGFKPNVE
ncbi:MAG: glycerol acyltransferase [Bernardetiaceae bacterium]|nr:glycerol acyltransferase [Bernardetiaceae bacterium]